MHYNLENSHKYKCTTVKEMYEVCYATCKDELIKLNASLTERSKIHVYLIKLPGFVLIISVLDSVPLFCRSCHLET